MIGFSDLKIGLLGSVYFAGMLAGTLAAPAIVRRVGHIRAFSVFVAVAIVAVDHDAGMGAAGGVDALPRARSASSSPASTR